MEAELEEQARRVLERCRRDGLRLALVEACAGGLISASLTAIPGSSAVVELGLVPYSNESKQELLGVPRQLLEVHGAVSAEAAGYVDANNLYGWAMSQFLPIGNYK
jgi:nicotinamide-nucleotide amidase